MADLRLRQLERRWKASGAGEDELPLLRHRLRVCGPRWGRLAFAGYLGDPELQATLGIRARLEFPTSKHLKRWCLRLFPYGREVWAAVAVQAARSAVGLHHLSDDPRLAWLLCITEAWRACPCRDHARRAHEVRLSVGEIPPTEHALTAAGHAATFAAQWREERPAPRSSLLPLAESVLAAARALGGPGQWTTLHGVLREALLPWARGNG